LEIINSLQKTILQNFGVVKDSKQFYLTGGTALSQFYLKHRRSEDLDFFTAIPDIILSFSFNLEEHLKLLGLSIRRQRGLNSFVELQAGRGKELTIIHLAQDTVFRFEPVKQFLEYPQVSIDNLVDIASNKLLALFGRAALRDFIDVYFLVSKSEFSTDQLVELARKKDPGFDLYWLGIAFERIRQFNQDSVDMLLLVQPVEFVQLAAFFNKWEKKITDEIKQ